MANNSKPVAAKKPKAVGTRREVMAGKAMHTSGGLYKKDLKKNKQGKIVSIRQSEKGQEQQKHLGPWRAHLEKFRKGHPKMSLKEAMKEASKTYKKAKKAPVAKKAGKKATKKAPSKKVKKTTKKSKK